MTIDFPANRPHWRRLFRFSLFLIFGWTALGLLALDDIRDVSFDDWTWIARAIGFPVVLGTSILQLYITVRKLYFSKFAVRLTDGGISLDYDFLTRFYPWEQFTKATVRQRLESFTMSRSKVRLKIQFHKKSGSGKVTYYFMYIDTTLPAFTEALERFIPVEVPQSITDMLGPDQ